MDDSGRAALFDAFNERARRSNWQLRADPALAFESPVLLEAFSIWKRQANGRRWPSRAEMTPRVMKNFLAEVALFDVVRNSETTRYRMRIMGTKIEEIFFHAPGKFIDEVLTEPILEKWKAILGFVLAVGGPVRFAGPVQFRGQQYLEAEEFFAPLGNPDQAADALFGVARIQPARNIASAIHETAAR